MSFPYLLDSMVSDDKLVINNIENPLYLMSYFSCCFQDFLSWSLTFNNLIIMFWGMALSEVILLEIVEIIGCIYLYLSSKFGCPHAFIFFKYFSFSLSFSLPSGTFILCRMVSLWCCIGLLGAVHLFFILSVPHIG